MPFTTIEDMYKNTDFQLALIPATTYEDNFKHFVYSDEFWIVLYQGDNQQNFLIREIHFDKSVLTLINR